MSAVAQAKVQSQAQGKTYLSINNIEVIYDHVILVLKGVSLEVPQGKIVALLGANGAGKTTTLKAISNLLRAERGDVTKGSIDEAKIFKTALSAQQIYTEYSAGQSNSCNSKKGYS